MSDRSSAQRDPYADKSVREIEEEIARTREALSRDLDDLGWHLSPERFAAQARGAVQRAQDAALKSTHELSDKLLERTTASGAGLAQTLQHHALPVTLVGLGVAVLAMGGDEAHRRGRDARTVMVSPQGTGAYPATPQRARRGRRKGLGGLIDRRPVAAGAVTVLAGLLVGLALPAEERQSAPPPAEPRPSRTSRVVRARRA
ncbi:DUF3618 domain-containing protein [Truepera radiovictrix]|uniref:DUF3618 domain-containing protein n=1 Tax=Truepera radiovictrix (strain DSM 17093 / CIP 108686 / LMG 22925 / RQ-24) TaxID=649638 RepID=D7CRY7_TRURR|nr:DUF3618 domain-containing protein [Truepera radiovictrix]ADI15315.1 hypothetical protein Trad_2204 [Truepera radiovictrix DSM 17093]WMT56134.1 DUF3618 domain-containing protein [Truepera radiovictrix]